MPIQTSYPFLHTPGHEGQCIGVGPKEVITCWSDEDLYPGRVVVYPSTYAEDTFGRPQVESPSATGGVVVGIVEYARNEELSDYIDFLSVVDSTQTRAYKAGTAVPVMIKGLLKVYVEEAVNPTSDVFFRHTASTAPNDTVGRFRTDADTNTADQITAGAKFAGSTSEAGLVDLRINFPQ